MFRSNILLSEVLREKLQCHRETLTATTEIPQEMSATAEELQEMLLATAKLPAEAPAAMPSVVPPTEVGSHPCGVEQLPCPGKWGTCPSEVPPIMMPVLPASLQSPAEKPSRLVPRGSCLIHNWQEERATNHLDSMPGCEPGSEGFTYRHGHHGLLVHQLLSWLTDSTTTKDIYRPPHRALLLGRGEAEHSHPSKLCDPPKRQQGDLNCRADGTLLPAGQRKAMLESMLYQKYRKEMLEKMCPQQMPMELVSTTHQDYHAGGCQFMPLPTTQPHNYCTEQPCSFWLEQAHQLPGVTSIRSWDSPFRRNAAFSTPITEYLEQPLPCVPLSSCLRPQKQ
ncbi:sperm-associated antigen 8 [Athene noctua]|uniref:sperm-associated antigen 8 n=1 Tax=Athene noctua TaxID=126797 RepID=UPI003EB98575